MDTGETNRGKRKEGRGQKRNVGGVCKNTKKVNDGNKAGGVTKQLEKVSAACLS